MLNLTRVMKAKADDLTWLLSPYRQCYLTSFPPVIHFHPCPCLHTFFWRWRIRRLRQVLWVTSMPFPESCLGDVFPPFLLHRCHSSNSITVNMATTTEVYMSSHVVFQRSFKPPLLTPRLRCQNTVIKNFCLCFSVWQNENSRLLLAAYRLLCTTFLH